MTTKNMDEREDRREDGAMTKPPIIKANPGLRQHKTEDGGSYLRRAASISGYAAMSELLDPAGAGVKISKKISKSCQGHLGP